MIEPTDCPICRLAGSARPRDVLSAVIYECGCGYSVRIPNKYTDEIKSKAPQCEEAGTGAVRNHLYPPGEKFPMRLDLLFRNAAGLRRLAETYGEGVAKYGPDNWMKGFPESQLVAHTLEHMRLYLAGNKDEDHIGHAMWNLFTLCWVNQNKPELMDLSKPVQQV